MLLPLALLFAGTAISRAGPTDDNAGNPGDPYGIILKPIPDRLVVLTFDDSCASHATFVGPLLKKYRFGGTFYVSDAFSFRTRKDWYMTWEQIKTLEDMGFEIGNHTVGHGQLGATGLEGCTSGVMGIEAQCLQNQVAKPTTFCWPFYSVNNKFLAVLTEKGYLFARGGGERPYRPTADNPLDVPSFTIHANSLQNKESFANAARQATRGRIVVFTFHGVPDAEHPAVGVEPARFEELMKYLKGNGYTAIAMRDIAGYVDAAKAAQLLSHPFCFPWGGRCLPWGWVTGKNNLLYLCVSQLPADRKLALPGMTTKISNAYFLADPKRQPLVITKLDTGIQTIVVPEFSSSALGASPAVIVAELQGGPIATILDFVFPGMPEATISGSRIRVKVPLAADLTRLAPIYKTGSPLVAGKPASGSAHDFTTPQTYTITAADGTTKSYVVTVVPTLGAVGVSNHSFEKFDVLTEYDDTVGKNPSGAFWSFRQSRPGDEVGINLLAGGPIFAPPAPDGTRHSAFIRGAGNGISQSVTFDKGSYTVSFDVVRRRGYSTVSTPLSVTMDGVPVLTLNSSQITEAWASYTSPPFMVTSGNHTLAFTLGDGDGMDLIDNVVVAHSR